MYFAQSLEDSIVLFKFNALALKCVADNVRNIFISQKQRETFLLDVPRASCCRFQDGDCIAKNFLLKVNVTGKSENDTAVIRKKGILGFKVKLKNPAL